MPRRWRPLVVPVKTASVKLIIHAGKLVGILMKPRAVRLVRNACRERTVGGITEPETFLNIGDDRFTNQTRELQVGAWLGVRVYLDLKGIMRDRMMNGSGEH